MGEEWRRRGEGGNLFSIFFLQGPFWKALSHVSHSLLTTPSAFTPPLLINQSSIKSLTTPILKRTATSVPLCIMAPLTTQILPNTLSLWLLHILPFSMTAMSGTPPPWAGLPESVKSGSVSGLLPLDFILG